MFTIFSQTWGERIKLTIEGEQGKILRMGYDHFKENRMNQMKEIDNFQSINSVYLVHTFHTISLNNSLLWQTSSTTNLKCSGKEQSRPRGQKGAGGEGESDNEIEISGWSDS